MDPLAGTILTGVAAFAATNLDDLFLLVVYFAIGWGRARDVVLGQYIGIGVLFAVSALAAQLSVAIPAGYMFLLGILPVLIGLNQLVDRHSNGLETPPRAGILPVAAATLANGGDNLGVYISLFATSSGFAIGVYGLVFAVMTGAWCLAARWLVHHPAAGAPLRRYGPRLAPFVLIAIGVAILAG